MAIWQARLDTLREVILADVARGDYFGAVLTIGRGGEVVFEEALGAEDAAGERPLKLDNVFSIFSVTKAFTNVLILKAIEEGRFALTSKIKDVLPQFTGKPREEATFYHLLTHTAGMPGVWSPKPGMYLDRLDELFVIADTITVMRDGRTIATQPAAERTSCLCMTTCTDAISAATMDSTPSSRRMSAALRSVLMAHMEACSAERPCEPIASTIMRYRCWPWSLYTWTASKRLAWVSVMIVW